MVIPLAVVSTQMVAQAKESENLTFNNLEWPTVDPVEHFSTMRAK